MAKPEHGHPRRGVPASPGEDASASPGNGATLDPDIAETAAGSTPGVSAPALSPGSVLAGRWEVKRFVGRGGMGEVWHAWDLKLQVDVALKALIADPVRGVGASERIRAEVRSARSVTSPNVCRIFDLVEVDGVELVTMEYVDGMTLLDVLREHAPLPLEEASEIAAQLLTGLDAIHSAGLVHRDVKPENIMLTRSGRVVLMDLGIARPMAARGTITGTPAYKAPEHLSGAVADVRADIFATGIVLAEMVAPEGLSDRSSREKLWRAVRQQPPVVPEGPWAALLARAVARDPGERFSSAVDLLRALEEVSLQGSGREEASPYPGLAPFSEADAEYFFGREAEVEAVWRKLSRAHLLAIIGPSGAGKSSFLRAGLIAAKPHGWAHLVCTPGDAPFVALGQALAPHVSGDTEAVERLLRFEEEDVAVELFRRWARQHENTLVILDQFEELYTLNPDEVQDRFASLLGRLALEADVRVLLAMRDDFLLHCHKHPALRPVFSELTPLGPPTGEDLRRALVQPALRCGYHFAHDGVADEMLAEVEGELGALPLLAFAAARLWERRDRDERHLTRAAYAEIGGVGGALARHAEAVLESVGNERIPLVRELFRNLVTAEGTRAVREVDELLSVFPAELRGTAGDVLKGLVDSRLLVSYDHTDRDGNTVHGIEVVHESLLVNWPRLVRWRSQDADSALMRDQLRQAARLWEERGRPEDLLWTGASYREFELWRERYVGGISKTEEAFAGAMAGLASRRRRRRGLAAAAVFVSLILALGVIASLWRQAAAERDRAGRETARAEANQLLALGRLELQEDPTSALAYALASLERADQPVTRSFALEALHRGPTALVLAGTSASPEPEFSVDFSPDGRWLATGGEDGIVQVWPATGADPIVLELRAGETVDVEFATPELLVTRTWPGHAVQVWSIPGGGLVRTLPTDGPVDFRIAGQPRRIITFSEAGPHTRVEAWPLVEGAPELIGRLGSDLHRWSRFPGPWKIDIDPAASTAAYIPIGSTRKSVDTPPQFYLADLRGGHDVRPRRVAGHQDFVSGLRFSPDGRRLVSADQGGTVRIWSLDGAAPAVERELRRPASWLERLSFDASASRLATASGEAEVWNLEGPAGAGPAVLRSGDAVSIRDASIHPGGLWVATVSDQGASVWPIERRSPLDLHGHERTVSDIAFLPDGRWLASSSQDGTLRLWPLSAGEGTRSRVVFELEDTWLAELAVDPAGSRLLVTSASDQSVWLVPVDGRPARRLGVIAHPAFRVALGDRAAAASSRVGDQGSAGRFEVRWWDLESGDVRSLQRDERVHDLELMSNDRVIVSGPDGIRIWDPRSGDVSAISDRNCAGLDLSKDGRWLLAGGQGEDGEAMIYDLVEGTSRLLDSHGGNTYGGGLDARAEIVWTGPLGDGFVRVGPTTGAPPHVLVDQEYVWRAAISPDGEWIATISGGASPAIRLWPVPDVSKAPLQTLPHRQLLAKLRALTNLRVVEDDESPTGWGWSLAPFPGWQRLPDF